MSGKTPETQFMAPSVQVLTSQQAWELGVASGFPDG